MKVGEIMKRLVHATRAEATMEQPAGYLRDMTIGFRPAVDETLAKETHLKQTVAAVLSLDDISAVDPLASGKVLQAITAQERQDAAQTLQDLRVAHTASLLARC